jgi:putative aldouronate transport system permease protein
MLIIRIGGIMNVYFEKVLLMYSPITYETADVINTYIYRKGILLSDYGFSAAVGTFNSVINLILLVAANKISRKVSEIKLW